MSDHTPNSCSLYIIQDKHGAVKIGIAANADQRLRDLQVGNPHELTLVYKLEFASRKIAQEVEIILHRRYANDAVRGEWFSTNAETLIADIEFAVNVGAVIQRFSQEYTPKPKAKASRKKVLLQAAQLDEIAKWAIRRGSISYAALMDNFQYDEKTTRAILYTFNRFGCLLPVDGEPGEYRYDPQWKSRQGVQV